MVVLLIALIVLGPDKLPNAARQVGKYLNEFRRISQGFQQELRSAIDMAADPVSTFTQPMPGDAGSAPNAVTPIEPEPDLDPGAEGREPTPGTGRRRPTPRAAERPRGGSRSEPRSRRRRAPPPTPSFGRWPGSRADPRTDPCSPDPDPAVVQVAEPTAPSRPPTALDPRPDPPAPLETTREPVAPPVAEPNHTAHRPDPAARSALVHELSPDRDQGGRRRSDDPLGAHRRAAGPGSSGAIIAILIGAVVRTPGSCYRRCWCSRSDPTRTARSRASNNCKHHRRQPDRPAAHPGPDRRLPGDHPGHAGAGLAAVALHHPGPVPAREEVRRPVSRPGRPVVFFLLGAAVAYITLQPTLIFLNAVGGSNIKQVYNIGRRLPRSW